MHARTQFLTRFAALISLGILSAQYYVQSHWVAGNIERTVRDAATCSGRFVVPLLLVVAYWRWTRVAQAELPRWRRGLGLGFFVVLPSAWTVLATLEIVGSLWPAGGFFNLNWLALLVAMCEIGALLAAFLKYESRSLAFASAFLMMAWLQAGIYF
jgi:hypothetical protein